jgi:hypothetical protein
MLTEIDQVELRWTGENQSGFSIIAVSDTCDSETWAPRLQPIARPPKLQQLVTVIYQIFGDDAAVIFRVMMPSAASAELPATPDSLPAVIQPARDSLVARALVGPRELLSPEIALASSFSAISPADFPSFLVPAPGKVLAGDRLPTVSRSALDSLMKRVAPNLDDLARDDSALEPVIAAALTNPAVTLTLQLPPHEVGAQSVVALLWGLWRTTSPLLAAAPGWQWSFSTGEAPLGDTELGSLPHLIVQSLPSRFDPPPSVQLDAENIVQPRTNGISVGRGENIVAARLLVTSYRNQSIEDFMARLRKISAHGGTLGSRLAAITADLGDSRTMTPASGTVSSSRDRTWDDAPPVQKTGARHRAAPAPLLNDAFPHSPYRPDSLSLPVLHYAVDSYSHLFGRLAAFDINSERMLDRIFDKHEQGDTLDEKERLHLRATMVQEGWYVRQFDYLQTYDVDRCVGLLLDLTVKPDLANPASRPDLIQQSWAWIIDERTPAVVVIALDDIISEHRDYELQQVLLKGMGYRWRRDHVRYRVLPAPAKISATTARQAKQGRWWELFKEPYVPAIRASILLWMCVIELLVFAMFLVIQG